MTSKRKQNKKEMNRLNIFGGKKLVQITSDSEKETIKNADVSEPNVKGIVNIRTLSEYTKEKAPWKSDLKIIKSGDIYIPLDILNILISINHEFKNEEFSIAVKVCGDNPYYLDPDNYMIPEQEVSAGSVDYKEPIPQGYAVIHKHPSGCRSFSGTDDDFLNGSVFMSILYIPPFEFPASVINYTLNDDTKIQINGNVKIYVKKGTTWDKEKIKKLVRPRFGYNYGNQSDRIYPYLSNTKFNYHSKGEFDPLID